MSSYPVGTVLIGKERVEGCQRDGVVRPCDAGMECIMHCLFSGVSAETASKLAKIYSYETKR